MDTLQQKLQQLQDLGYQEMQIRIIPNINVQKIIGVRTPVLRQLAKSFPQSEEFLNSLPHAFFEEDQIHAFLLSSGQSFQDVVAKVDVFLPHVDNWATCDQMNPKIFRKHRAELLPYIEKWISSEHTYAIRFGIKMLMDHFLEEDFSPYYLELVASIYTEEYYVRMMIAWYFATALAKQYEAAYPYLVQHRLERWIHNKTIQKAVESFRISQEHKEQLKMLRHS